MMSASGRNLLQVSSIVGTVVLDVLSLVPHPLVSASIQAFKGTVDMLQVVSTQKAQAIALIELTAEVLRIVDRKLKETQRRVGSIPSSTEENVTRLQTALLDIQADFEKLTIPSFLKRLLRKDQMADALTRHHTAIIAQLHLFGIESQIDQAASDAADREARKEDSVKLDKILQDYANNQKKLTSLFGKEQSQKAEINEIRDLLYLCARQMNATTPGKVERVFYQAMYEKMKRLAGGRISESPDWVVSPLEIDIGEEIGAGAFSRVHRGEWNGEEVAIKFLQEGASESILFREAEAWRRLVHPRIHRFYRACPAGNPPFLVSALHRNGDALRYLQRNPRKDPWKLVRDIASGMSYLHSQNCLHGDLKASNVLIDDSGRACISDFGLSSIKLESARISRNRSNDSDPVYGTLRWMAPERIDGGILDRKVDVYAFAMVCYLYTGEIPFGHSPESHIPALVVDNRRRPARPSDGPSTRVADDLWGLMESCWHWDPNERPDFPSIVVALDSIRRGSSVSSTGSIRSDPPPPYMTPPKQERPLESAEQVAQTSKLIRDADGAVIGGKLAKLVKNLTSMDTQDPGFEQTFFISLPTFTSVKELIDQLVARFYVHPPTGTTTADIDEWVRDCQEPTRARIIEVFKTVVRCDGLFYTINNEDFESIQSFVHNCLTYYPDIKAIKELDDLLPTDLNMPRVRGPPRSFRSRSSPPIPVFPSVDAGRSIRLLDIFPQELARQLTLRDVDLYCKIVSLDYLARSNSSEENGLSHALFIAQKTSQWVLESVLRDTEVTQRAKIIEQFIAVANECLYLRNYQSLYSIVLGLESTAIERLDKTWALIRAEYVQMLKKISTISKAERDISSRSQILREGERPCLPSIGIYRRRVEIVKERPKHFRTNTGDEVINFGNQRDFASILLDAMAEMENYQSTTYNFLSVKMIQEYIQRSVIAPPEKTKKYFIELSKQREPAVPTRVGR